MEVEAEFDAMIADDMGRFFDDPLGFVMYAYDWVNDKDIQVCKLQHPYDLMFDSEFGPDKWACDFLTYIGEQVKLHGFDRDNPIPVAPIKEAVASGHGIGKSAMCAWLVDWIMSTRPGSRGTVTANTADQLATKTWAAVVRWTSKCITGHWFNVSSGKGSMRMVRKDDPDSFCHAQTCREENSEAFAGQHAATATSFYIFDESSAVPKAICDVAEKGGLSDGEPMFFKFGNPTQNSGDFYDCFHSMSHRWHGTYIDSRNVQITNKKLIEEMISDYGIDSDMVKIRVRGMFPAMSAKQFISTTDVDAAFGKHLKDEQWNFAPVILSCDPAWEGDDELVIGKRQGLKFEILKVIPKNDNDIEIANIMMRLEDEHKADAVFIDAGYGTGIVSAGRTLGRDWQLVWFASKSADAGCLNKRMEMWKGARDWLKMGGAIPNDAVLHRDLITPELVPRMDGIMQLESKKDMKHRGEASPGRGDALALTFAHPVMRRDARRPNSGALDQNKREHDPYANLGVKRNGRTYNDPRGSQCSHQFHRCYGVTATGATCCHASTHRTTARSASTRRGGAAQTEPGSICSHRAFKYHAHRTGWRVVGGAQPRQEHLAWAIAHGSDSTKPESLTRPTL